MVMFLTSAFRMVEHMRAHAGQVDQLAMPDPSSSHRGNHLKVRPPHNLDNDGLDVAGPINLSSDNIRRQELCRASAQPRSLGLAPGVTSYHGAVERRMVPAEEATS
jgi:hypothetical protein